jgi:hypothetical protein
MNFSKKNYLIYRDVKVEDKAITFATMGDEEEDDQEDFSDKFSTQKKKKMEGDGGEDDDGEDDSDDQEDQERMQKENRKKRVCNKMDKLFLMLFDDLNALMQWENEEKKKLEDKTPDAFNYSGLIWVHRGILAERLNRKRLAERAFRNAIERGFSLFAWYKLLTIYGETFNPKACLVCIAEILDQAEEDGIENFPKVRSQNLQILASNLGGTSTQ